MQCVAEIPTRVPDDGEAGRSAGDTHRRSFRFADPHRKLAGPSGLDAGNVGPTTLRVTAARDDPSRHRRNAALLAGQRISSGSADRSGPTAVVEDADVLGQSRL